MILDGRSSFTILDWHEWQKTLNILKGWLQKWTGLGIVYNFCNMERVNMHFTMIKQFHTNMIPQFYTSYLLENGRLAKSLQVPRSLAPTYIVCQI
jgi:hypothetical protein